MVQLCKMGHISTYNYNLALLTTWPSFWQMVVIVADMGGIKVIIYLGDMVIVWTNPSMCGSKCISYLKGWWQLVL